MNKIFAGCAFVCAILTVSCSPNCDQPLRDAFNFYVVNGSGDDIFGLDPSLNKDSVYLSVIKNSVEQPATRSIFTRQVIGSDTFNTFYNPDIPDLNINSDTQTVFLYLPRNPRLTLQVVTYSDIEKCGSVLRIGKVNQGLTEALKTEGYYKILR